MKFRQAKKIVHGNSSVYKKYSRQRPPYTNEEGKKVYTSLHDIDIIRRAVRVFLHHYKRHKRKELR